MIPYYKPARMPPSSKGFDPSQYPLAPGYDFDPADPEAMQRHLAQNPIAPTDPVAAMALRRGNIAMQRQIGYDKADSPGPRLNTLDAANAGNRAIVPIGMVNRAQGGVAGIDGSGFLNTQAQAAAGMAQRAALGKNPANSFYRNDPGVLYRSPEIARRPASPAQANRAAMSAAGVPRETIREQVYLEKQREAQRAQEIQGAQHAAALKGMTPGQLAASEFQLALAGAQGKAKGRNYLDPNLEARGKGILTSINAMSRELTSTTDPDRAQQLQGEIAALRADYDKLYAPQPEAQQQPAVPSGIADIDWRDQIGKRQDKPRGLGRGYSVGADGRRVEVGGASPGPAISGSNLSMGRDDGLSSNGAPDQPIVSQSVVDEPLTARGAGQSVRNTGAWALGLPGRAWNLGMDAAVGLGEVSGDFMGGLMGQEPAQPTVPVAIAQPRPTKTQYIVAGPGGLPAKVQVPDDSGQQPVVPQSMIAQQPTQPAPMLAQSGPMQVGPQGLPPGAVSRVTFRNGVKGFKMHDDSYVDENGQPIPVGG